MPGTKTSATRLEPRSVRSTRVRKSPDWSSVRSSPTLMKTTVESGVSDVRSVVWPTLSNGNGAVTDRAVYGYCLIVGTVIGCIAGVPGTNGYARESLDILGSPRNSADPRSVFITGRVIIGFGLASFLMTSLIVVQEITHPRTRSLHAHAWNQYYIMGLIIASWVNFGCSYISGTWGWVRCNTSHTMSGFADLAANSVHHPTALGGIHPHRCPVRARDSPISHGQGPTRRGSGLLGRVPR